jgi:hypothetical protein
MNNFSRQRNAEREKGEWEKKEINREVITNYQLPITHAQ